MAQNSDIFRTSISEHVTALIDTFNTASDGTDMALIRSRLGSYGLSADTKIITIPFTQDDLDHASDIGSAYEWIDPNLHQQIQRMSSLRREMDQTGQTVTPNSGAAYSEVSDVAIVFDNFQAETDKYGDVYASARLTTSVGHELVHGSLSHLIENEFTLIDHDTISAQGISGLNHRPSRAIFKPHGGAEFAGQTYSGSWLEEGHAVRLAALVIEGGFSEATIDFAVDGPMEAYGLKSVHIPSRYILVPENRDQAFPQGDSPAAASLDQLIDKIPETETLITACYKDNEALEELHAFLASTLGDRAYAIAVDQYAPRTEWPVVIQAIDSL